MELYEAILKRVACRSFTSKQVPLEILLKMLRAGTMAPSAENYQPWEFILITRQETRQQLTRLKVESRKRVLRNMFPDLSEEELESKVQGNREALAKASWLVAVCYRDMDNKDETGDMKISLSHAAAWTCIAHIWLAATAEGIGLSPTFFPHDVYNDVRTILGLPDVYHLAAVLRIGYPRKKTLGLKRTIIGLDRKLHHDLFQDVKENNQLNERR